MLAWKPNSLLKCDAPTIKQEKNVFSMVDVRITVRHNVYSVFSKLNVTLM